PIGIKATEPKNNTTETNRVNILLPLDFNDHLKISEILCVNASKPASNPCTILPKIEVSLKYSNLPKREYNHGTTVNDTNNDNNVDIITVTQNCARILATKPVDIAIGKNTTTITNVIAVTVNPISDAPS